MNGFYRLKSRRKRSIFKFRLLLNIGRGLPAQPIRLLLRTVSYKRDEIQARLLTSAKLFGVFPIKHLLKLGDKVFMRNVATTQKQQHATTDLTTMANYQGFQLMQYGSITKASYYMRR